MQTSEAIVSKNLDFIRCAWEHREEWLHSKRHRDLAVDMLNQFDDMTYGKYWLTPEEEAFLDSFTDLMEVYC